MFDKKTALNVKQRKALPGERDDSARLTEQRDIGSCDDALVVQE